MCKLWGTEHPRLQQVGCLELQQPLRLQLERQGCLRDGAITAPTNSAQSSLSVPPLQKYSDTTPAATTPVASYEGVYIVPSTLLYCHSLMISSKTLNGEDIARLAHTVIMWQGTHPGLPRWLCGLFKPPRRAARDSGAAGCMQPGAD